ncbi:MAG: hypothetical protein IPO68_13510 [Chitinophagaceae bacterium]|nr:hypothetical protein [Chitinophagaceae bacterium]
MSYNVSAYESSSLISDQRIIFDKNDNAIIQVIKREGDEILGDGGFLELGELDELMEIKNIFKRYKYSKLVLETSSNTEFELDNMNCKYSINFLNTRIIIKKKDP